MPQPAPKSASTEGKSAAKSNRPWLRRLGYASGTIFLLLLLAGIIGWQFRHRIANSLLAKALPDFPGSIGTVDWKEGGFEFKDLSIRASGTDEEILHLPSGHVSLNLLAAANGKLGILSLESPTITIGKNFWKTIASLPTGKSGKGEFSLEGLRITHASLDLTAPDGQELKTGLEWDGADFKMHEDGSLESGKHSLTIQNLTARPDVKTPGAEAEWIKATFSLEREKHRLVVHELATSALSATAGVTLWKALGLDPATGSSPAPSTLVAPAPSSNPLQEVQIEKATVGPVDVKFRHLPWLPKLPAGRGQVTLEISHLLSSLHSLPQEGEIKTTVSNVKLGEENETAWIDLPSVSSHAEIGTDGDLIVHSADVRAARIELSPSRLEALGCPSGLPPLELVGTFQMHFEELLFHGGDILSMHEQAFEWNDASLRIAGAERPIMTWPAFKITATLDEIINQQRLRTLNWVRPVVRITGTEISALFPQTPPGPSNSAGPENAPPPFLSGWLVDAPTISDGVISATNLGQGAPDIDSRLDLKVFQGNLQLTLGDIVVATPDHPKAPALYRGQSLVITANPSDLWRRKRIESVSLQGSQVQVGVTEADSQIPIIAGQTASESFLPSDIIVPEQQDGPAPEGWHVGNIDFENTKIYLHNLVPDVAEVLLPISKKTFHNVPLTAEGLSQNEHEERIELPLVYIPGTRAGTSVADLDTNFIYFTLGGLMRREIKMVECVNPKIYVGDSLFHYVDKIRAQAAEESEPVAAPITQARLVLASLISLLAEGDGKVTATSTSDAGWKIDRLKAVNGKLITTVKDSPLFRVPPLPFGSDSTISEGEINAQLAVPPGLYKPVLGMELVVAISEGNIIFNLPAKDKDNNLVQVFKADWVRFKQFRIADVTLQVTYDKNGLYAKFWAKGYQGDLEGAFNLYFDNNLSWDMWLTGTGIQTADITKTLTPAYLHMDGKVDLSLVAQGDKSSLYQATGSFKNRSSGKINILALEDVIKSLPEDWSEAQLKWTKKSLETLRDFNYNNCNATLRFYGLEGEIHLKLNGPDGERNFDVFSHDRRVHVDAPGP